MGLAGLLLLLSVTGCGTIQMTGMGYFSPYCGVRFNVRSLDGPGTPSMPGSDALATNLWPMAIVDLPLCAVVDTVLLPVSIWFTSDDGFPIVSTVREGQASIASARASTDV